ncbi:alcohol dehydrogenase catalytic domain-containing protein [Brooklawnia cerclae]|uniref:2-desacetyl-2-hydroxyethyl bacteriochlorophyllide A dehydrogenase n=1 Tax=Brooklawnia cerclae TaxID=349934 RepID=A0ABX0SH99_9ACTN|nr:alcohol dehydrogenase catalytic domain-containing protein [Brooklawnia cerclae]NIH57254.1 2-desacetyl-2-hydroxyethyl bacteriochlorophyllide A dehydrogenase [Brooklawnia cerclae]
MKSLYFARENEIELWDVDVPTPGPGEVKVKTAFASICATDIHQVTQGVLGAKPPMPLGHETSGTVVELGPGTEASGLKVGDKVTSFPVAVCGQCRNCKSGMPQYCLNAAPFGGFSEYYVTSVNSVFPLPADADLKSFTITEPTVCAVRAMDLVPIKHGQTVAISGIGGIGAILMNAILLSGAAKITVIEPVAAKRQMALELGASHAIDPTTQDVVAEATRITDGLGFDVVFEASGSPRAARPALDSVAKCGRVVYFAVYPPDYELGLNLYELYSKEASIHTVFTNPDLFPRAINLVPRLALDHIIGPVIPLSRALEGVELFHSGQYPKIILDCTK